MPESLVGKAFLDAGWLNAQQLGGFKAYATGDIAIDAAVQVAPGGEIALHAPEVQVNAGLSARGGGIVHPVMKSIANAFDSDPAKGTEKKVGTYLALVNYHANPITSAMFLTATAPNPLVVDFVAKASGQSFHLTWTTWALCMLLPGLVCLLLMPLIIYWLSPPELKATPDAVTYAKAELKSMGPLSPSEKVMLGTFALLLLLWANVPAMLFGPAFSLDATVVAFVGLFVLIITGTIDWDDV
ncbi:MAG: anion permease, partial [Janthinobacterium sp.]